MSSTPEVHRPVLLAETLEALRPAAGETHFDATVGAAGHATAMLERVGSSGLLIGVDRDPEVLELARSKLEKVGSPFFLAHAAFTEIRQVLELAGQRREGVLDGVLFDLGVSSLQLDRPERGFSFLRDGPLDMRMDPESEPSAASYLRTVSVAELTSALREFGEEPAAGRIARAIDQVRRREELTTTGQLARVVESVVPRGRKKTHPATRTFQAIRIAINGELELLRRTLRDLDRVVKPGGRVVVLSYHSLEDRLVKTSFRERVGEGLYRWIHRQPVTPTDEEVQRNPRARSAKLRAVERSVN